MTQPLQFLAIGSTNTIGVLAFQNTRTKDYPTDATIVLESLVSKVGGVAVTSPTTSLVNRAMPYDSGTGANSVYSCSIPPDATLSPGYYTANILATKGTGVRRWALLCLARR